MFSTINTIIFFLWLAAAAFGIAEWTYLFQLKEYRLDKLRVFFSTQQGKQMFFSKLLLVRFLAAMTFFFAPFNDMLTIKYGIVTFLTLDVLFQFFRYLKKRLHLPVRTKKALCVCLLSLLLEGVLFIMLKEWWLLPFLSAFRIFYVSFVVAFLSYPTRYLKQNMIMQATQKMRQYDGSLTVIGVTGSYGKTTVKEFLSHVLGTRFRVVCTPEHINTDIGVAQCILKTDFSQKDIFIVEMGAYCNGEIEAICRIVQPKIGILTTISQQHISLFGSIQNIQQAKYELLRTLPKDGLAITNSDNPYCREFLETLPCHIQTFGFEERYSPTLRIVRTAKTDTGISCVYAIDSKEYELTAPHVLGIHNAVNLAPCFLAARRVGMTPQQFTESLTSLAQPPRSLEQLVYGKAIILDDSYNANPDGFLAALDALSYFPADRRCAVITRGMLELGEKSSSIHTMIGKRIASFADELIIISTDEQDALTKGVQTSHSRTKVQLILEPEKLFAYLEEKMNENVILLFENRLPQDVYKKVLAKSRPYDKTP